MHRVSLFPGFVLLFLILSPGCFFKKNQESLDNIERRLALLEADQREARAEQKGELEKIDQRLVAISKHLGATEEPAESVATLPDEEPLPEEKDAAAVEAEPSVETLARAQLEAEPEATGDSEPAVASDTEAAVASDTEPEIASYGPKDKTETQTGQDDQTGQPQPNMEPLISMPDQDLPYVAMEEVAGLYRDAMARYQAKKYEEAFKGFSAIVNHQPQHGLAPNALYWAGEVQYDLSALEKAADLFLKVVDSYPNSNKAADALLKFGKCHERLGHFEQAQKAYEKVIASYGDSNAADLARDLL